MWKWTCPKTPNLVWEHHSWTSMNESLTAHEDGSNIPGFGVIVGCSEEHEYWDDGIPCGQKNCNKRYIRNDEPSSERR